MTDPEPTADPSRETGVWPLIRTERAALAADLADLPDEQWATPLLERLARHCRGPNGTASGSCCAGVPGSARRDQPPGRSRPAEVRRHARCAR